MGKGEREKTEPNEGGLYQPRRAPHERLSVSPFPFPPFPFSPIPLPSALTIAKLINQRSRVISHPVKPVVVKNHDLLQSFTA